MDHCLINSFELLAAGSFWAEPANYLAILKVVFGLGAVIFVHELGHFLAAKYCGVKCDKFYVGFDVPIRLFGQTIIPGKLFHFQWGETEYGIGSIPLGGYVKMMGQDDNPGNVEEQVRDSLVEGETTESAILPSGMIDRSKLDPRSFIAKSVPERMLIISAGVVFNLIFAVVFAAIAFGSGVKYEPPVLGNVTGGGPAWKHNLVGAKVIKVGDREIRDDEYFPYLSFAERVVFNGDESKISLTVIPHGETEPVTKSITPEKGFRREMPDLAMIGAEASLVPVIGEQLTMEGTPAANAQPPLEAGDTILEINGTPVESEIDLRQVLARDADKPATFLLERTTGKGKNQTTEKITSVIQPYPTREVGFGPKWGSIAAIKVDSPAEQAGLKVGDEIVSINGQDRGSLLTVDQRMIDAIKSDQSITLQIKRDGKTIDVPISPVIPKLFPFPGPNKPVAVDSLGVAIPLTLDVETVVSGGPADKAGLLQGDQLVSVDYSLSEEQQAMDRYERLKDMDPIVLGEPGKETSWAEVYFNIQSMEVGTKLELVIDRNGTQKTLELTTEESDKYFQPKRGFFLAPLQVSYQSKDWLSAFKYGFLQVGEDLKRVGKTLSSLVRGKISPKNLGGPGTIAVAATSEATQGTSRLLLFLTFLSANLAIVNFLPIPVLDGGHMMFLAYEAIFRKPPPERIQAALTWGGLIFILSLMGFVLFMDYTRITGWL